MRNVIITLFVLLATYFITYLILGSKVVVVTDLTEKPLKEGMVYYYIPESQLKIKSTAKIIVKYNQEENKILEPPELIEQEFQIIAENIPDTKNLLTLLYISNAFMSDSLGYKVSNLGLLESMDVITEDKTAKIISEITTATKTILSSSGIKAKPDEAIIKINEYSKDFIVRAAELDPDKLFNWKIIVPNELGIGQHYILDASFGIKNENASNKNALKELIESGTASIDGLLTRPIKNVSLTLSTNINANEDKGIIHLIQIIDPARLINVPIERAMFAKMENKVGFKDGIIVSNEIIKPSSVNGFISIPVDIAKAIVSIPGELISIKYNNTSSFEKQNSLLEKRILENEKSKLKMETEIAKLEKEIEKLNNAEK